MFKYRKGTIGRFEEEFKLNSKSIEGWTKIADALSERRRKVPRESLRWKILLWLWRRAIDTKIFLIKEQVRLLHEYKWIFEAGEMIKDVMKEGS